MGCQEKGTSGRCELAESSTVPEDSSGVEEPSSPVKFSKRPRNKPQRVKSDLSTSIRRLVKKRKHNTDTGTEKKQSLTEDESGKKETQEKAFSEFSSVLKSVQDTLQGIMDIKQKQKLKKKEE